MKTDIGGHWDEEVDLLVCGSGAAGMTAALVAAHEGLSVVVCEKLKQVGGTTATSGGMAWVPGNPQSGRIGMQDSTDDARRSLASELGDDADPEMLEAFLQAAPLAIRYLDKRTEVKFDVPHPNPDYHPGPGASAAGRTLVPRVFDGRLLGADFDLVRRPLDNLMILSGMMVARREVALLLRPLASVKAFSFTTTAISRYLADRLRYARGTRLLLGNALVARLLFSLRRKNVPIRLGAALNELIAEDGKVTGALIEHEGSLRAIRARRGVVLATGGFAGSESWRKRLTARHPVQHSLAFADSSGDGFDLATAVGATVNESDDNPVFWAPVSVLKRRDGSESLWMHGVLDRAKPGLIAVNAAGKRFVNEGVSYHDFVVGMYDSRDASAVPAHLVCDRGFIRKYGIGMVQPLPLFSGLGRFLKAGYLKQADTLAGLAAQIGVDAANLEATVAEHNRYA